MNKLLSICLITQLCFINIYGGIAEYVREKAQEVTETDHIHGDHISAAYRHAAENGRIQVMDRLHRDYITTSEGHAVSRGDLEAGMKGAAKNGHSGAIKRIIGHDNIYGAHVSDESLGESVSLASANGHYLAAHEVLKHPKADKISPEHLGASLKAAAAGKDLSLVDALLSKANAGLISKEDISTALQNAVKNPDHELGAQVVDRVITNFDDLADMNVLFEEALRAGNMDVVNAIINNPRMASRVDALVRSVVQSGKPDVINNLLQIKGLKTKIDPQLLQAAYEKQEALSASSSESDLSDALDGLSDHDSLLSRSTTLSSVGDDPSGEENPYDNLSASDLNDKLLSKAKKREWSKFDLVLKSKNARALTSENLARVLRTAAKDGMSVRVSEILKFSAEHHKTLTKTDLSDALQRASDLREKGWFDDGHNPHVWAAKEILDYAHLGPEKYLQSLRGSGLTVRDSASESSVVTLDRDTVAAALKNFSKFGINDSEVAQKRLLRLVRTGQISATEVGEALKGAIEGDRAATIMGIVDSGVPIPQDDLNAAIKWAEENGKGAFVERIIRSDRNKGNLKYNAKNLFNGAIESDNADTIDKLLRDRTSSITDAEVNKAVLEAAKKGKPNALDALLKSGRTVSQKTLLDALDTTLRESGGRQMAENLVKYIKVEDLSQQDLKRILHGAAKQGYSDVAGKVLESDATRNVNSISKSELSEALVDFVKAGDLASVQKIFQYKEEVWSKMPAANVRAALEEAALSGRADMMKVILDHKNTAGGIDAATVHKIINDLFEKKMDEQGFKVCAEFLKCDYTRNDVKEKDLTRLVRQAAQYGDTDIVNIVLNGDRLHEVSDSVLSEALIGAARGGHAQVVKQLVDYMDSDRARQQKRKFDKQSLGLALKDSMLYDDGKAEYDAEGNKIPNGYEQVAEIILTHDKGAVGRARNFLDEMKDSVKKAFLDALPGPIRAKLIAEMEDSPVTVKTTVTDEQWHNIQTLADQHYGALPRQSEVRSTQPKDVGAKAKDGDSVNFTQAKRSALDQSRHDKYMDKATTNDRYSLKEYSQSLIAQLRELQGLPLKEQARRLQLSGKDPSFAINVLAKDLRDQENLSRISLRETLYDFKEGESTGNVVSHVRSYRSQHVIDNLKQLISILEEKDHLSPLTREEKDRLRKRADKRYGLNSKDVTNARHDKYSRKAIGEESDSVDLYTQKLLAQLRDDDIDAKNETLTKATINLRGRSLEYAQSKIQEALDKQESYVRENKLRGLFTRQESLRSQGIIDDLEKLQAIVGKPDKSIRVRIEDAVVSAVKDQS